MESFKIGESKVRFNDDMCDYILIRKPFQHSAYFVMKDFVENIQKVTDFDEIYDRYYKIALEIVCDGIKDIGMDILDAFDVTWYSLNDVLEPVHIKMASKIMAKEITARKTTSSLS